MTRCFHPSKVYLSFNQQLGEQEMSLFRTTIGVALLSLCFTLPANASLLTFYDDGLTPSGERFTLSCLLTCQAWDGVDFLGTDGDLFDLANNGEQTEIDEVNSITGETYTSLAKTDRGGVSSAMFTSSAEYILIKIGQGPDVGIIRNLSAGNKFTFTATGQGAGFSHSSEFGRIPAVPVPAAVWLFGTALIGFIGISRRTKV